PPRRCRGVVVRDVGREAPRVAVWPQARSRLVPYEIALRHEPRHRCPGGEGRTDVLLLPVLIGIAHDDDGIAARLEDAYKLPERPLHRVEVGRVVSCIC